jgi:hypothetical protein
MIILCYVLVKNILFSFQSLMRLEIINYDMTNNHFKYFGEHINIFLCVLAGFLTLKFSSKILFLFFNINLNILILQEYQNFNSYVIDNFFFVILFITNTLLIIYSVNYFILKNKVIWGIIETRIEFFSGSFSLVSQEINYKIDLLKMNINNLIITSGFKKHFSWFLYNLKDYYFCRMESQSSNMNKNCKVQNEINYNNNEKGENECFLESYDSNLIKSSSTLDLSI